MTSRKSIARLLSLVAALVAPCCSSWPGLDEPRRDDGGGAAAEPPGTCSGTALPCGVLGTTDCSASVGCTDTGSCSGSSVDRSAACATELTPYDCNGTRGCNWTTVCTGTPYGTCSAFTKSACLVSKGCIWTPTGSGGSGGSVSCPTYGLQCRSKADCDCGYDCLVVCNGCPSACGPTCKVDADCATATGLSGVRLPFCYRPTGVTSTFPGICSVR